MTYSWFGEKLKWVKNQRKIGTHLKIGEIGSNKKKEILEGVQKLERNVTDSKIESNWDRFERVQKLEKIGTNSKIKNKLGLNQKLKSNCDGLKNWRELWHIQKSERNCVKNWREIGKIGSRAVGVLDRI